MKHDELKSMSMDELWELHEQVGPELGRKMVTEKATLEARLRKLSTISQKPSSTSQKRAYPKVLRKCRNPKNRSETWAGRGRQPRWLAAQLRSGKKLEDFQIARA